MDTDGDGGSGSQLKRFEKKLRQIQRLIASEAAGRELNAEERTKVDSLATLQAQLSILRAPSTPAVGTPAAASGSATSAAFTRPAACAASAFTDAAQALNDVKEPVRRAFTRTSAEAVGRQMAQERAAFEQQRQAAQQRALEAEREMCGLLRTPLESWDEQAIWQLAMCEFAVFRIDDETSTPKQLQLAFREACEEARHPGEVPRLRGSLQIDALRDALADSELLRLELQQQLDRFKRLYSSLFSGFGRFRRVTSQPGESLLGLMRRTHLESLQWRPPGRTLAEQVAIISKVGGKYTAEWREDTYLQRHADTGVTVSLRGVVGMNMGFKRRLMRVPNAHTPATEHFTTVRLHDYQAHHIQRSKSLTNTFVKERCLLQWDEVPPPAVPLTHAPPRPLSHLNLRTVPTR